jgi:hypothetical protein
MEKQITETFYKAFYDSIESTVRSDKPDYDWIVKLYTEIRDRLCRYFKKDSKTYIQINNSFDIPLFKQMIENDVFDGNSLIKVIDTTYYWIEQLQAPIRDESTRESKNKVLSITDPYKVIPCFIVECNTCLDLFDIDMYKHLTNNK